MLYNKSVYHNARYLSTIYFKNSNEIKNFFTFNIAQAK